MSPAIPGDCGQQQSGQTMRDAQPAAIYLKDYQPPHYLVARTELHFDLREEYTLVRARLEAERR